MNTEMTDPNAPAEPAPMGSYERLLGVFTEPGRTFESINRRPTFLLAIVVGILISLAATYVLYSKVDMVQVMESSIRSSSAGRQLSAEQIRQQVDTITTSPFYKVMLWAGPLLSTPVIVFALAGLLMLMVFLGGSETTYLKMLGVTSHTMLFYSVVAGLLMVLVLMLAPDPQAIDIQNPLFTNPGPLVDAKEYPVLNRILTSLDVITLYVIFLLGLGLSKVAARLRLGKAVMLAAVPWLVYVGIAVLWRAVFG